MQRHRVLLQWALLVAACWLLYTAHGVRIRQSQDGSLSESGSEEGPSLDGDSPVGSDSQSESDADSSSSSSSDSGSSSGSSAAAAGDDEDGGHPTVFKGKIEVIHNENDMISNLNPSPDPSAMNEARAKKKEQHAWRMEQLKENLKLADLKDEQRSKAGDRAEQHNKKAAAGTDKAAKERRALDEARSKTDENDRQKQFAAAKAQAEKEKKEEQAQKARETSQEGAEKAADVDREKKSMACRKPRRNPSSSAGSFAPKTSSFGVYFNVPAQSGRYPATTADRLRFPRGRNVWIKFDASCSNDIHVLLRTSPEPINDPGSYRNKVYELVLGGWGNGRSCIRLGTQKNEVTAVGGQVCTGSPTPIWVAYQDGLVRAGKGVNLGQNTFLQYRDPHPIDVQYFELSSWNRAIQYHNVFWGVNENVEFSGFTGPWTFDAKALIKGDFDGDGKQDFARLGGQSVRFFISKGDGTFFMPIYQFPVGWDFSFNEKSWATIGGIDVNGDKRTDIVRTSATYNHVLISQGPPASCFQRDGFVDGSCFKISAYRYPNSWSFSGEASFDAPQAITGDFNGDGKGDYARIMPTYIHFFISQGDGQFWAPVYQFPNGWNFGNDENSWTTAVADFNADCKTDIIRNGAKYHHGFISSTTANAKSCFEKASGNMDPACFKATTFYYPNGWNFVGGWSWNSRAFIKLDFNGDGKFDFARLGATYMHMFVSQGNGQFYYPVYYYPRNLNFGVDESSWTTIQGDFDGDGRGDFIRSSGRTAFGFFPRGSDAACFKTNTNVAATCFTVTQFNYPSGWNFVGGWTWDSRATLVADLNGDGKDDFGNLRGRVHGNFLLAA